MSDKAVYRTAPATPGLLKIDGLGIRVKNIHVISESPYFDKKKTP